LADLDIKNKLRQGRKGHSTKNEKLSTKRLYAFLIPYIQYLPELTWKECEKQKQRLTVIK
jgi:hypothetical protein